MTYGTFICSDCATKHGEHFSQFESYIKPLNDRDAWDTFQITCIQVGGNKRFFDYMRMYGKDRDEIENKYSSDAARYYRRRLCAQAMNKPFKDKQPPKNIQEFANNTL